MFVGPGDSPDKYELLEVRSRGGEGEVWKAALFIDSVHYPVAVKLILPANVSNFGEWRDRWARQAEMLRSLNHPGLVTVREVFVGPAPHAWSAADAATSTLGLVMNWVEGPTLAEWVARNPNRDVADVLRVVGGLAEAVDYLHSAGPGGQAVLHRDIKPANVIVTDNGPKLVDFGFVRTAGSSESMTMVGSPGYIAPEVVAGHGFSEASDRFAFGGTTYYAITGHVPNVYDAAQLRATLEAQPALAERPALVDHLLSMLDPDPTRRPTSATEWVQGIAAMSFVRNTTVLRTPSVPASGPSATVPQPTPGDTGRKSGGKKLLVGALGALVLVAAVVIGAVALAGGGDDGDDEASAEPVPTTVASGGSTDDAKPTTTAPRSSTTTTTSTTTTVPVAVVPEVVGQPSDQAITTLRGLGAVVTVEKVYSPDHAEGTVLEQIPAAGAAVTKTATIRVATGPAQLFLGDLDAVTRNYLSPSQGSAINGQVYVHSLDARPGYNCEGCRKTNAYAEYNLGRAFDRLRGTLGYSDTASSSGRVRVEVFGDTNLLYTRDIGLGEQDELDINVTGVLRIRIQVTPLVAGNRLTTVFGDARLLGDPAAVDAYLKSTGG